MTARGIGNMGQVRRPPPLRHFLQLYRGETAFQALVDFAVLGGLTIAFLEPQILKHPFSSDANKAAAPQQQTAPPPAPVPAPVAQPPAAAAPKAAPQARTEPPATTPPAAGSQLSPAADRAIANLRQLPPWPQNALVPVTTPGLQDVPIPFANSVLSAPQPPSRFLTIDERTIARQPAELQGSLRIALAARADQNITRIREALQNVDTPDGTADLLIGLSHLLSPAPENIGLAEAAYRKALDKGQPQAPVMLGLLLTSGMRGLSGAPAEGKALIEAAAAANDRIAWYETGAGFLSGASGMLDPSKGVTWIRRAAEAGEPVALFQLARLAEGGIGMEKNVPLAEAAIRRAAELGLTDAEDTLGRWILAAYEKRKIDDPGEGVALQERVLAKNVLFAMNVLGRMYNGFGQPPKWKDEVRGAKLYQACADYRIRQCHNNYGMVLQTGHGIDRDIVAAWARYDVGRQLAGDFVMPGLAQVDKILTPSEKELAQKQSKEIMASLKPFPPVIVLRRDR